MNSPRQFPPSKTVNTGGTTKRLDTSSWLTFFLAIGAESDVEVPVRLDLPGSVSGEVPGVETIILPTVLAVGVGAHRGVLAVGAHLGFLAVGVGTHRGILETTVAF